MAVHCLDEALAIELIRRVDLADGNPDKISLNNLVAMSSEERRNFFIETFSSVIKDKQNTLKIAKDANWFFEEKLLLKDKEAGLMRWWNKLVLPPKLKRDIFKKLTNKKNTMLLNPATERAFLADLAEHVLGIAVTMEEATQIHKNAKRVVDTREAMEKGPRRDWVKHGKPTETEMAYGRAVVAFKNYMEKAKKSSQRLKWQEYFSFKGIGAVTSGLAGISKTMKATWDMSYLFRQGQKTFWSSPTIWFKNSLQMFKDVIKAAGKQNVMDEISAEVYSHPLYEKMVKDKLAITTVEEEMIGSSTIEKVPFIGKLQKMSDVAYTGLAYRNRIALYEKYTNMADKLGYQETTNLGIGKVVNALTGRGGLWKLEPAGDVINKFMFSPRLLTANLSFLTSHLTDSNVSGLMKFQAAKNLLLNIGGMAMVFALNSLLNPEGAEEDPTSSDFGKIRIGNSRFDFTGGIGPIIVLAARLWTGKSKSSSTMIKRNISAFEFGSQDQLDLIYDFFENKRAPLISQISEIITGRTFDGGKTSIGSVVTGLFVPIIVEQGFEQSTDPYAADTLLSIIAEGLGIGVTTYSFCNEHWETKTTKEMAQFKAQFGEQELLKANKYYNIKMNEWFQKIRDLKAYRAMPDEDKEKMITKKKNEMKKYIFGLYGFKTQYAPSSSNPTMEKLLNL